MSKKIVFSVLSALLILSFVLTACGAGAPPAAGPAGVQTDKNASIEVWIDAAREESAGKFIKAFPDKGKLVSLTTTDYGQLPQKILFWNNVGGGWPDASFGGPNIVPVINDAAHNYLGDLAPYIDPKIIEGFAPGSLQNCWDGTKLYCVRNDLAHFVLWYNATKVKELGIKVPETYEELADTCASLKQSHPEIQCALGQEITSFFNILVSNKCPFQQILSAGQIRINATHENCVKAAQWLDKMSKDGYYKLTNMFAAETSDLVKSDNWLFMPSSSWFGDYVIKGTYYDAADPKFQGKIGVAPMPKWQGQDHAWVFWWGGAAWVMSRHTKNPQLTADFLTYMTTDVIKEQGTYPAYMPAAEEWLKTRMPTLTYLEDTTKAGEVLKSEAGHMWTMATEGPVDINALFGPISAKINAGELTYEASLTEMQKVLVDGAGKLGYTPVTTGLDDFK
ncbi:MAG: ABC transporter substrate-binding protein [Chloroflexi bacterium]|nr:ABC transporter substrate-binding protein [Chloroflexota bacterium]